MNHPESGSKPIARRPRFRDDPLWVDATIVLVILLLFGLGAMVLMAYSHWRAMNRLADIATALPLGRGLGGAPPFAALGPGDAQVVSVGPGPIEQSNGRLLLGTRLRPDFLTRADVEVVVRA